MMIKYFCNSNTAEEEEEQRRYREEIEGNRIGEEKRREKEERECYSPKGNDDQNFLQVLKQSIIIIILYNHQ